MMMRWVCCKTTRNKNAPFVDIIKNSLHLEKVRTPAPKDFFWYIRINNNGRGIEKSFIAPSENVKFSLSD